MNVDLSDFTAPQRFALLDLLVLSTYLDRHLGSAEDERVKRLLMAMGCITPYDRRREFDAAVTRVRPYADHPDLVRAHAVTLGKRFSTREQCQQVCALIHDLVSCDGQITEAEKHLLDVLQDTFQV
jgi:uncharacterized tellurite resistance protein B-like protein